MSGHDANACQGAVHGFSVEFRFPVYFTRGIWNSANTLFRDTVSAPEPRRRHRVFIAIDDAVAAAHPRLIADIQQYFAVHGDVLGLATEPVRVPGGETAKNELAHLFALLADLNNAAMDRHSYVVAIGGGAVLDVVSLAAALAHRGIRTVRLPTTVLAQADSGIAVKNSVNLFGKKNFAGTFVPPFAVINDGTYLDTLPPRERIAGLAEVVKVALLRDAVLFAQLELEAAALVTGERDALTHAVRRSAELHLGHICGNGDPFELGSARPLDFGHWAAHKLEMMTGHRINHGEAVAIGMALDTRYAARVGLLDDLTAERILRLLEALGFRLWDPALLQPSADGGLTLLEGLREFREHLGGELHVTLLRGIGHSLEVSSIDQTLMLEAVGDLAGRAVSASQPRRAGAPAV